MYAKCSLTKAQAATSVPCSLSRRPCVPVRAREAPGAPERPGVGGTGWVGGWCHLMHTARTIRIFRGIMTESANTAAPESPSFFLLSLRSLQVSRGGDGVAAPDPGSQATLRWAGWPQGPHGGSSSLTLGLASGRPRAPHRKEQPLLPWSRHRAVCFLPAGSHTPVSSWNPQSEAMGADWDKGHRALVTTGGGWAHLGGTQPQEA